MWRFEKVVPLLIGVIIVAVFGTFAVMYIHEAANQFIDDLNTATGNMIGACHG